MNLANLIICLITVNFIHAIDPNTLKSLYDSIFDHVDVRYIIIDCVEGEGYKYFHNPAVILPQYRIAKTIGTGYTGGRTTYLLEKK